MLTNSLTTGACTHRAHVCGHHIYSFPPDPPRVSADLLAISCTHPWQWGAALLICHSSSTVDHCPKGEANCTDLPPESTEVTGVSKAKTGTSRGAVTDKGFDGVRELGKYKGKLFLSLFCNDTLQHFNVRRKWLISRRNIYPSEIASLSEFPSNPWS